VLVRRVGHPSGGKFTLAKYAAAAHVMVSVSGDPHGPVDKLLAEHGLSRRVMLTVPNFLHALAVTAETDLVAALPRKFAQRHARRYHRQQFAVELQCVHFRQLPGGWRAARRRSGARFDAPARHRSRRPRRAAPPPLEGVVDSKVSNALTGSPADAPLRCKASGAFLLRTKPQ